MGKTTVLCRFCRLAFLVVHLICCVVTQFQHHPRCGLISIRLPAHTDAIIRRSIDDEGCSHSRQRGSDALKRAEPKDQEGHGQRRGCVLLLIVDKRKTRPPRRQPGRFTSGEERKQLTALLVSPRLHVWAAETMVCSVAAPSSSHPQLKPSPPLINITPHNRGKVERLNTA